METEAGNSTLHPTTRKLHNNFLVADHHWDGSKA